jgi:transposase
MKRYILNLTEDERAGLEDVVGSAKKWPEKARRARILLLADEGMTDEEICEEAEAGLRTVERVRKRAAEEGIKAALERKSQQRPSRERTLDGRAEAQLVRLACGPAPEGRCRWTLSLLAGKLVELEIVDSVSVTTVCRTLKKTRSSLGE